MALALDASLCVADIAQIYADVLRDYTLSELCIMSRFRPVTPEDKGGLRRLFKQHVSALSGGACVRVRGQFSLDVRRNFSLMSLCRCETLLNCFKLIQMAVLWSWIMKSACLC